VLGGRIFDDRGYRMSPTYAKKNGIKYRYYISAALVQGQTEQAGSISRVPAIEIEGAVTDAIRKHLGRPASSDDAGLIDDRVVRVEVQPDHLIIELAGTRAANSRRKGRTERIKIPWRKQPLRRRREVLLPASTTAQTIRPMRSENRALLVASIARGRRWLDELITNPAANVERIAAREGCSVRKVNMTISLAFLAPDLVKAAIEGRLPYGMGVTRLCDLPAEWSRQHRMLGLTSH
jgi:hypothetical protein